MYRTDIINEKMKEKGLTANDLAEKADLNHNTISKVRNGKETVQVLTLRKAADALEIPMKELFTELAA